MPFLEYSKEAFQVAVNIKDESERLSSLRDVALAMQKCGFDLVPPFYEATIKDDAIGSHRPDEPSAYAVEKGPKVLAITGHFDEAENVASQIPELNVSSDAYRSDGLESGAMRVRLVSWRPSLTGTRSVAGAKADARALRGNRVVSQIGDSGMERNGLASYLACSGLLVVRRSSLAALKWSGVETALIPRFQAAAASWNMRESEPLETNRCRFIVSRQKCKTARASASDLCREAGFCRQQSPPASRK